MDYILECASGYFGSDCFQKCIHPTFGEDCQYIYVTVSKLTVIIRMDAYIRREQFLKSQVCSLNTYF